MNKEEKRKLEEMIENIIEQKKVKRKEKSEDLYLKENTYEYRKGKKEGGGRV